MNKITKFMALCGAVALSASALAIDLNNVSNGPIKLGEWNSNFAAGKAYAEANGVPLFVFWSNPGCAKCNKMKTACNLADFVAWRQQQNIVFIISEGDATVKSFAKNSSGHFPYMRLYWPAKGVDERFSGRAGEIPGSGSTLQGQLMSALEKLTAGAVGPHDPIQPVGPVGPIVPVIGDEWKRSRKLSAVVYDANGAIAGRLDVKADKVKTSGVYKGKAKLTVKLMGVDGKTKSFKSGYATVSKTSTASLSGAAGTASLKITGNQVEGTVNSVVYGACTVAAAVVGGTLADGPCVFSLESYPEDCEGFAVIKPTEFLPLAQEFTVSSGRLLFPRKGSIKFDKKSGEFVMNSMDNPSGLKFSYKPATGFFKGSFAVYADKANGRGAKKKYTATVTGFVVDGIGEGVATVKKVGSYPCMVTVK